MKIIKSFLFAVLLLPVIGNSQAAVLVSDNSFPHEIVSLVERYPINIPVTTSIINNTNDVLNISISTESKNFLSDWDVADESPYLDELYSVEGGFSIDVFTHITIMTNDQKDVGTGVETLKIIATNNAGTEVANQTYEIPYTVSLPPVPQPTFVITNFEYDSTTVDTIYLPLDFPDPFSKEFQGFLEINFLDFYWIERPIVFEPLELILENIESIECMHEDPHEMDPTKSWCNGDTITRTNHFINYHEMFGFLGPDDDFRLEYLINVYDPVDSINSNQQVRIIGQPADCVWGQFANLVDLSNNAIYTCPGGNVTINANPQYGSLSWNLESDGTTLSGSSVTFNNVQEHIDIYVTTRDENGCLLFQYISVQIEERYEEIVDIDQHDIEVCRGSDLTLSLLPGYDEAQWYNEMEGTTTSGNTYTLTNIQDYLQILVRAENADGCFSYQEIYIYINEEGIEAEIFPESYFEVCTNGDLNLEVDSEYSEVEWNILTTGQVFQGNILELTDIVDFYEIELKGTKDNGCTYRQWLYVHAIDDEQYNPDLVITEVDNEQCRKTTIQAADGFENYEWYGFNQDNGEFELLSEDQELLLDYTGDLEIHSAYIQLYANAPDGCREFFEFNISLKFPEEKTLIDDSNTGDYCAGDLIEVAVNESYESYQWSYLGQISTSSTFAFEAGTDPVQLIVVDSEGCTFRDVFFSTVGNLAVPSLCLITNDPMSGNNVILWEDPADIANISSYVVLREGSSTNEFQAIGELDFEEDNMLVDKDSDPTQKAYKYQIKATNDCGDLSQASNTHKTIHLTINQGTNENVNLIWDSYEGISYDQIKIFRGGSLDSLEEYIGLPGNAFSFTDQNPPAGNVYYQIEVTTEIECEIGKALYKIKSNVAVFETEGDSTDELELTGKVYPNPFTNFIYLELEQQADLQLVSLDGRVVLSRQLERGEHTISTFDFMPGAYILKVISGDRIFAKTFVKTE